MANYETLLLTVEEGIGVLTINRPKALNALNAAVMRDLDQALSDIEANDDIKVVILTGSGEKSFVAGADITEMKDMNVGQGKAWAEKSQAIFLRMENFCKPIIAAVNGFALGGGNEICMACDIRIASENALFGQPEVGLGIIPGFGGTQRLSRLVGKGFAKYCILANSNFKADEAYRVGLVQKVVPQAELLGEAKAIAKKIMKQSQVAVQYAKICINRGMDVDITTGMEIEAVAFGACFAAEDQKEGMTAFVEKRKAAFTGKY